MFQNLIYHYQIFFQILRVKTNFLRWKTDWYVFSTTAYKNVDFVKNCNFQKYFIMLMFQIRWKWRKTWTSLFLFFWIQCFRIVFRLKKDINIPSQKLLTVDRIVWAFKIRQKNEIILCINTLLWLTKVETNQNKEYLSITNSEIFLYLNSNSLTNLFALLRSIYGRVFFKKCLRIFWRLSISLNLLNENCHSVRFYVKRKK